MANILSLGGIEELKKDQSQAIRNFGSSRNLFTALPIRNTAATVFGPQADQRDHEGNRGIIALSQA